MEKSLSHTTRTTSLPHHRLTPRIILLSAVLALASCASPPPTSTTMPAPVAAHEEPAAHVALRKLVAQQDRLYQVAAPLLVSNSDLCRANARNLLGFTAQNKYSYSAEYADAAQSLFGLDERLRVTGVLSGSGAARAGVQRGDILVAVEDKPMPTGQDAERQAATVLVPLVASRASVKLTVQRGAGSAVLDVPLTRACAYSIKLGNADHVNAYSDGQRILITRGMMNFAQSNEELAAVLAKEMAHNALSHAARQKQNGTIGEIIDNLASTQPDLSTLGGMAGVKPMPQDLDAAADTLSLYMLARAGYNIDHSVRFWERLAVQYPATVPNGYTAIHPATGHRLATMARTVQEVRSKQAARQPLTP